MKPWEQYQQPEAAPWESYQAQPEEQPILATMGGQAPGGNTAADVGLAAVGGANVLAPSLLGLPVDVAQNIANLGIAGYGVARKEIGEALGEEGYIPPETLPPQPGGSQWMREKIAEASRKLGGGDPFALPDPSDPTQQKAALAGTILATGAMAPATGPAGMAANVGKMAIPAAGALGMQEAFPEQPLAPMVGMMAAPAGIAAASKAKSVIAPKIEASKAFIKAHKLGYKVPPALAKPTKTQQFAEGTAGPVPTKQKASIHNQQVTNKLIKKDIGYPEDVPLSQDGLNLIRQQAGKAYDRTKVIGVFKSDPSYVKSLSGIAKQGSAMAKDFPKAVRKDVVDMVKTYSKKQMSAEGTVEAVKQLRADSSAGYNSPDPSISAMARAKGKVADALEGLMERQAAQTHPDLVPALKAARQRIAKTYTIEKALKGENIDAVALGRQLDKGKPLSGGIRDVAEFGQNFKGAAQTNVPQSTNFRPMDLVAGVGGAVGTGNPAWLAAMAARPALRSVLLSKPYQTLLAKPKFSMAIQKAMKLPDTEAIAALNAIMAQEAQRSGNADSMQLASTKNKIIYSIISIM